MRIVNLRDDPAYLERGIAYFQTVWPSIDGRVYDDAIRHSMTTDFALPRWYVLEKDGELIGSIGLVTNDFISRMDLLPWACALYIEEAHRGNGYAGLLVRHVVRETEKAGFRCLYLCTDHTGLYEKFGFRYIGQGYHAGGEESRIYEKKIK